MTSFYYKPYKSSDADNIVKPIENRVEPFHARPALEVKNSGDTKSLSHIRNVKPSGFHNLPTQVLFSIFQHVSEDELRKNIIPVCHKWRQVALSPELWHSIKFEGFHIPSNFICQQLRLFTDLQHISLINIIDITTIVRQICRCNTQITSITMKNCRNDKGDEKVPERVLRNLVVTCKKLEEINLKATQFYGNLFYIEVALLPNLKSINLSNNEYLTTKNIFEFVLNCQQLEEFKLSYRNKNQYMSDNDAVFLFSNLRFLLKSITFDMMDLTDISLKTLLECENLEKLYLFNASNISSKVLINISKKLPYLKHLKIHHSQISTPEIIGLFKTGSDNLQNLQSVNLTGSWKFNSEGLKILTNGCPRLQKAVFRCCKNLESIECLFEDSTPLEILDVAFCPKLPDNDLLDAPNKMTRLQIFYTDISRNLIAENIKINKPNLVVYICLSEFNKNLIKT